MGEPRAFARSCGAVRLGRAIRWACLAALLIAAPTGATELILVERPVEARSPRGLVPLCASGSRLVHLDADGASRNLTPVFDGACDPSVSFDGREILFSGRKLADDRWRIWRLDLDTGTSVAVTDRPGHAASPLWVGSIFHLDDDSPTRRMAYLATETTGRRLPVLHTANLDGSNELRISYSPDADLAPELLPNGRIVYPSVRPGLGAALMGLNIDGTDLAAFADPHDTLSSPHAVRIGSDDRVYFIESAGRIPDGGALVFVSLRRPLRTRTVLAATEDGLFLDPAPMSDGSLLASFRAYGTESYKLVRVDTGDGSILSTVHDHDGYHILDAHELVPRPVAPGRSTVVDTSRSTGVFFCLSSHITDRPALAHLRDGGASRLRVVESHVQHDPPMMERVLGEAPIEPDGSFHIEVPARTPVRFQLLDAEGDTIAEQKSWTWVMPREWRGCIGCHEDRESTPPNVLADAVVKPAVRVGMDPQPSGGE